MRPAPTLLAAMLLALLSACVLEVGSTRSLRARLGSDGTCGRCHADVADELLASPLHRAGGSEGCDTCHAPHRPAVGADGDAADSELGPAELTATCEDCHAEVAAEFRLPFAHPLERIEGCTACHEPHGGTRREQREDLRHHRCEECHNEVAGPYVFHHEGDRTRGCISCHTPHGSANRRLLTYADTRGLCMSCHLLLDGAHISNPGSIYNDCLHCHVAVHGSNWDGDFLR